MINMYIKCVYESNILFHEFNIYFVFKINPRIESFRTSTSTIPRGNLPEGPGEHKMISLENNQRPGSVSSSPEWEQNRQNLRSRRHSPPQRRVRQHRCIRSRSDRLRPSSAAPPLDKREPRLGLERP